MSIHISNKKVNDIHVGSKKVLTAWIGTDRVYLASTLSMLIKGYTEKSGDSLLSANTPLKFTGVNLCNNENIIYDSLLRVNCSSEYQSGKLVIVPNSNVAYIGDVKSAGGIYNIGLGNKFIVEPSTQYAVSITNNDFNAVYICEFDNNNVSLGYTNVRYFPLFTTNPSTAYITFRIGISNANIGQRYETNVMLIKGSTAIPYEPYHETFYNPTEGFSLNGNEIAQDTFETLSGALDKLFENIVLNGNENWFKSSNPNIDRFIVPIPQAKTSQSGDNWIIPNFTYSNNSEVPMTFYVDNYGTNNTCRLIIMPSAYGTYTLEQWKEHLSNNNIAIAFRLATPQTYQKKPKTLPQWVKHVFDSSGRELEATITQ